VREIQELIDWYERGVLFRCGCRQDQIDPAVKRALLIGRLPIQALLRCPVHGQPVLWPDPDFVH
jgi:hypothetical protein